MKYLFEKWKALSLMTKGLCAFLLLNVIVICPLAAAFSWREQRTNTLSYTACMFTFDAGADSWMPLQMALDAVRGDSEKPLYQELFFDQGHKFIYPPSSLLIVDGLGRFPGIDLSHPAFLNLVSWLCIWATLWIALRLFTEARRPYQENARWIASPGDARTQAVLVLLFGLTFYPLLKPFQLGQIQTWINLLTAWALLCWVRQRFTLSAVLIGLACAMKPHFGLLLVWMAFRKQYRAAAAGLATIGAITLLSAIVYGFENVFGYLDVLSFISRRGEGFFPNQSFNGLLNRAFFRETSIFWNLHDYPPFHPVVYGGTLLTSLALLGSAFFRPFRKGPSGGSIDFSVAILSVTMASPIAWEHHYGVLFPILALSIPPMLEQRALGKATLVLLALAYILISQADTVTGHFANSWLNVLQSVLLAGALVVLFALHRLEDRPG